MIETVFQLQNYSIWLTLQLISLSWYKQDLSGSMKIKLNIDYPFSFWLFQLEKLPLLFLDYKTC